MITVYAQTPITRVSTRQKRCVSPLLCSLISRLSTTSFLRFVLIKNKERSINQQALLRWPKYPPPTKWFRYIVSSASFLSHVPGQTCFLINLLLLILFAQDCLLGSPGTLPTHLGSFVYPLGGFIRHFKVPTSIYSSPSYLPGILWLFGRLNHSLVFFMYSLVL